MPPGAGDEQFELDRTQSALAAVLLGELDEVSSDADASSIGRGDDNIPNSLASSVI